MFCQRKQTFDSYFLAEKNIYASSFGFPPYIKHSVAGTVILSLVDDFRKAMVTAHRDVSLVSETEACVFGSWNHNYLISVTLLCQYCGLFVNESAL